MTFVPFIDFKQGGKLTQPAVNLFDYPCMPYQAQLLKKVVKSRMDLTSVVEAWFSRIEVLSCGETVGLITQEAI